MPHSLDNPSDSDLVRAVSQGDSRSFDILVDRHLYVVFAVARRILCNAADAEDVAQDTFLRAYERLYLYDIEQSFRNWLLKIATNLAINRLRSRRREKSLKTHAAERQRDEMPGRQEAGAAPAESNFKAWEYWLGRLNETQRTVIVLFHFHDMPYAQIAEAMEVPENTVRTHLHRGRKRLRELMQGFVTGENGSWEIGIPKS
ncbi:MAG TPA: RNA polymerase sigma factor [Phycisphaerae bacterium]|nr:RNA polymerase sigma factor [Phycisphaerae bacterium]